MLVPSSSSVPVAATDVIASSASPVGTSVLSSPGEGSSAVVPTEGVSHTPGVNVSQADELDIAASVTVMFQLVLEEQESSVGTSLVSDIGMRMLHTVFVKGCLSSTDCLQLQRWNCLPNRSLISATAHVKVFRMGSASRRIY